MVEIITYLYIFIHIYIVILWTHAILGGLWERSLKSLFKLYQGCYHHICIFVVGLDSYCSFTRVPPFHLHLLKVEAVLRFLFEIFLAFFPATMNSSPQNGSAASGTNQRRAVLFFKLLSKDRFISSFLSFATSVHRVLPQIFRLQNNRGMLLVVLMSIEAAERKSVSCTASTGSHEEELEQMH